MAARRLVPCMEIKSSGSFGLTPLPGLPNPLNPEGYLSQLIPSKLGMLKDISPLSIIIGIPKDPNIIPKFLLSLIATITGWGGVHLRYISFS